MSAHLQIPLDDEDAFRLVKTERELLGLYQRALRQIPAHLLMPSHRGFVQFCCRVAPENLSDRQAEQTHRLAWIYRSRLPAHLAPKINPDDPIVAEQRRKDRIHHV